MKSKYKRIKYIDAIAKGAIEYGDIRLEINGEEEWLEIQEMNEYPYFKAFVNSPESFEALGIKIDDDEIVDEKFLTELQKYYAEQSPKNR